MKRSPTIRAGFTLIELLIVIGIIVLLVALLMSGIYYAYATMKRTGAASDLNQLNASLQAFKAKYGVYPPSRIKLCSNYGGYGNAQLDTDSIAFINRMWPNIGQWSNVNWAGTGTPNVNEVLEGDQCLVFFLGGIPNPSGNNALPFGDSWGFSVNPKDPSAVNSNAGKVPPFFAFPSNRLFLRNGTNFASFQDYYALQPYLYFSAYNRKNGYAPSYAVPLLGVQPYFSAPNQFQNPDTYQIICAGADGNFGPGGQWTSATAETVYPSSPRSPGADDQTNFYSALMGVSQ